MISATIAEQSKGSVCSKGVWPFFHELDRNVCSISSQRYQTQWNSSLWTKFQCFDCNERQFEQKNNNDWADRHDTVVKKKLNWKNAGKKGACPKENRFELRSNFSVVNMTQYQP